MLWKIVVEKKMFWFACLKSSQPEENNCEDAAFLREGGVWALWAWWVRRTKLQNAAGNQEHKVIESCQQESGNVAIEGQKRTSFPERSRTFNRRECSRKPQPSRTLDNALFSNYLNPCLVNPLQWIPGRKARTTSDSLAVSPTPETSKYISISWNLSSRLLIQPFSHLHTRLPELTRWATVPR